MLTVNYRSLDGRFSLQFEAKEQTDLWTQIGEFQSVFEQDNTCGLCKSDKVFLQVRDVDGAKYFEKKCNNPGCYAALAYHQNKKGGTLYRTWNDKWAKYVPKPKDPEEVSPKKNGKK